MINCHISQCLYQTAKIKIVTKTGFYRQATAQCSMLTLQNAHVGAFCNVRMLHSALKCGENTINHIFEISVFQGFTVPWFNLLDFHFRSVPYLLAKASRQLIFIADPSASGDAIWFSWKCPELRHKLSYWIMYMYSDITEQANCVCVCICVCMCRGEGSFHPFWWPIS